MALTWTSRKLNGILRQSVRNLLGQRRGGGCQDDGNPFFCTSASTNTNDSISVEEMETERSQHPYKRLFPWKSKTEFVEDLLKNVVFNEGNISQNIDNVSGLSCM
jgi:hypothetical protein